MLNPSPGPSSCRCVDDGGWTRQGRQRLGKGRRARSHLKSLAGLQWTTWGSGPPDGDGSGPPASFPLGHWSFVGASALPSSAVEDVRVPKPRMGTPSCRRSFFRGVTSCPPTMPSSWLLLKGLAPWGLALGVPRPAGALLSLLLHLHQHLVFISPIHLHLSPGHAVHHRPLWDWLTGECTAGPSVTFIPYLPVPAASCSFYCIFQHCSTAVLSHLSYSSTFFSWTF